MTDNSAPGFGVLIALLLSLALYVWASAALAAVFRKLGEPGWKAWVPVYSSFVLFRLGGVAPLWAITLFLPLINVVGFVFSIFAIHSISKQFGKGAGFTVLGVLLTPIWSSILGWGRSSARGADTERAALESDAAAPASLAAVSPFGISAGEAVPARIPFGEPVQPAAPPVSAGPVSSAAPAAPAAPAVSVAPEVPAASAPSADEAVQESPTAPPVFSYTPAVIAAPAPAPAAPPAPIEMPEELSVRVEQAAGAPARAAAPLIDSVPDFSSPAAPPAAVAAAAAASVVLDEQQGESPAPQPADDDDDMDATVISGRRNKAWVFETESGQRVPLSAELVLLGRNPAPIADHPDAQLITVRDAGRTVSKTHASVQLQGSAWVITDLNSTNGVYVLDAEGAENELEPGIATEIAGRFVLGELSARIFQEE